MNHRARSRSLSIAALILCFCAGPLVAAAPAGTSPLSPGRIVFADARAENLLPEIYSIGSDGHGRQRLTRAPRRADYGAIPSPDGRRILFLRGARGTPDIYVMQENGTGARFVAAGDQPAWSPDGRRVAFTRPTSDSSTVVSTIGVDGKGLRRVAEGWLPSWSPDGRRIAYVAPDSRVWTVRLDGGDSRRIAPHVGRYQENDPSDPPQWSPDGTRIAFPAADQDADPVLVVAPATGGQGRTIARGTEPRWSPDGRLLAFNAVSGPDGNGPGGIALIRPSGRGFVRLVADRPGRYGGAPEWSPDGLSVAFVRSRGEDEQVFVVSRDGRGLRRVTDESAHSRASAIDQVMWLDSRRLVFSSNVSEDLDLFTMRPDGTSIRRLIDDSAMESQPAWSPDGRRIAFTRERDNGWGSVIGVMNADGSGARRLADVGGSDFAPAWSPDGRSIAFIHWEESGMILSVMRADGTGRRVVADVGPIEGGSEHAPSVDWSPDGRTFVVAHDTGQGLTLSFLPASGGAFTPLTNDGDVEGVGESFAPAWSPDGSSIAYIWAADYCPYCDEILHGLGSIGADGSRDHGVEVPGESDLGEPVTGAPRVAWSPDSRWLAFAGGRGIQIMRPDGSGWRLVSTGGDPDWSR